ncbi:MAG: Gfo/Idh/MocA family oxidoreductase [Phycisphaerales bacterium]
MRPSQTLSRRRLLIGTAGLTVAGMVPSRVLAGSGRIPPSEQLNVAVIGTGGQGITNIKNLLTHPDVNIVAICDPAEFWDNSKLYYRHNGGRGPALQTIKDHAEQTGSAGDHGCAVYTDYRVMLEKAAKHIDAVLVAAPNHVHAVACMAAIQAGKHVYCEKPLTHSVYEARRVAAAAREARVATQLGNQGHSSDDIRRAVEWIRDGAIGEVHQVHAWRGGANRMTLTERPRETPPVPEGLDWDLWLGPAPERPFHPAYAPLSFHYWWDFGSGTLGNFGCHTLDTALWALELGHPAMIEASSSELSEETTPATAMYHYKFPARGPHPEVDLFWYDGGLMPPRPECLEPNRNLPRAGGSLIVGDQGAILSGSWSESPRIIPERKMKEYRQPPQTIPRSAGHHRDWINACKGGPPASSNFEYGVQLTELVLLGVVALRTGETIHWDGPAMRAVNTPKAEPLIHGYFRKGWEM